MSLLSPLLFILPLFALSKSVRLFMFCTRTILSILVNSVLSVNFEPFTVLFDYSILHMYTVSGDEVAYEVMKSTTMQNPRH